MAQQDVATKQDINELADSINSLATSVEQGFKEAKKEREELREDFNKMLASLDAHTEKLDNFITEMKATDARVDRLERMLRKVAKETGVKLEE